MIKVLQVYRTYFPDTQGGLEEVIRQICRNTREEGVENRVFILSENPVPKVIGREEAQVHRFHRTFEVASCGVSVGALSGFKQLVEWADVVHYHFPWPFADLLHLFSRASKPSVVTYHSDVVRQKTLLWFYRPFMRAFLNKVDVIVPTSENYFSSSRELGRYSEKIDVIPIGLDEDIYPEVSKEEQQVVRERVGEGFFLFVGVLRYYKGLHILLDALQNTSVQCVITGAGPIEMKLKEQAVRLGLNNVQFLGYVSDNEKVALYHLCRAVVFPSHLRSEAFGVTLIEGAMFGKPLISCEIGTGTTYVNADGETGIVVPPANAKALREAMLQLDEDEVLADRLGKAARARYERLFTGRLMGKCYAQLYKKLRCE
ncbi:glycosyltransferase family 4 protein [Marinibactrum halimedae]|uniref:Glycosyltransferase WbpZ n=1 Tax=Marinibactrum halimedae TaxID=1444977 RepID=A0AA37T8X0_9GAMM|nr:glycosyltransferase family 4 protein [Marinibactrum halimedae]MCD9459834.1 glycosyltransferase family 4 protein [Marinibactrum halimedae]GLS26972.1 glycosyltransferase WbpZ [Marinibactrum halimedae]